MAFESESLTRRQALQGAVALVGGSITAAQLGPLANAIAAMNDQSAPRHLSAEQYSMLERIVDLVIPETDTPGALGAGVHRFIDLMLADWASAETRTRYVDALRAIDQRARRTTGAGLLRATPDRQLELLKVIDREAYADGAADTTFKDLKKLILFGYYSSETGASVELRYDRLPGAYIACRPFDDIGRSWST